MDKKDVLNFVKDKKVQWIATIIVFMIVLISGISIRTSNLDLLKDETTGEYLSNDLDSMYFYRVAETQLEQGSLPEFDSMRSPGYKTPWIPEIIDDVLVWNYKIMKVFVPGMTFNYASTISAPVLFAGGLVLFFILCLLLTKSKIASLIATAFLTYSPGFLFRSIAGFYDHDHIGVFALFGLMIGLYFAMKNYEKNYVRCCLLAVLVGFLTSLVFVSWGGAITFVLVFLPLALFAHYLFNVEKKEKFILFYLIWILSSIIFTPLLGSYASSLYNRILDTQGILVLFVFLYSVVDFSVKKYCNNFSFFKKKYCQIYPFVITIILGLIGLMLMGKNPLRMIKSAWATLIYPFFGTFSSRLSATVAENAQPYLVELIGQNGQILFWFFIIGLGFISWKFAENSKKFENKMIIFSSAFILFLAILFSRYAEGSWLNGENIRSQGVYILGVILFLGGFGYVYLKEKFNVKIELIILLSMAFTVVLNARAAVRSFFLIIPFMCLIGAYGIKCILDYFRIKSKGKSKKYLKIALIVFVFLLVYLFLFVNFSPLVKDVKWKWSDYPGAYALVSAQAKYVGPSANEQWVDAMAWARNETPTDSIFVHWWDYGYIVQTLGKRATVTDGGHSGGNHADHFIGRYVLTTPNPKTALSYMKSWNVDYLLIDPTEIGKYGAFSKIGSNDSWDRVSQGILSGASDESQVQETSTGFKKIYQLGGCVDGDITYFDGTKNIFVPGISITPQQRIACSAFIGGVIVEIKNGENGEISVKQPIAIFVHNNKRYEIPVKNVFVGNEKISFDEGLDAAVYFIPRVNEQDGSLDKLGAIIYLSPRTFNSLMGKLYVLNDPYNEYPTLEEAYFVDDPAVSYFKQIAGEDLGEFVWYQGLRAPLKIWKADYPEGTETHEEFLGLSKEIEFGGMDPLF